jgi:hypothetical protein
MEFTHLATFARSARGLLRETDVLELELALLLAPEAGDLIPRGGGLRKLRRPLAGRGKRGGARIIYYYVARDAHIYLVFAYAKSRRADLSPSQLDTLAKLFANQLP